MRLAHWILLIVLVFGAALRCYALSAKSLWLDEALSWRLIEFPVQEMIRRTGEGQTSHPPLYFLLLRGWRMLWGESEFALRSLAALCGIMTIAATYFGVTAFFRLESPAKSKRLKHFLFRGSPNEAALFAAILASSSAMQIFNSRQVPIGLGWDKWPGRADPPVVSRVLLEIGPGSVLSKRCGLPQSGQRSRERIVQVEQFCQSAKACERWGVINRGPDDRGKTGVIQRHPGDPSLRN